jgi:hypothetical protein
LASYEGGLGGRSYFELCISDRLLARRARIWDEGNWGERERRPPVTVETKQVYVPMEEWNIDAARKRLEARWLSEGWRRAHVVSVPGKPVYLITLQRDVG